MRALRKLLFLAMTVPLLTAGSPAAAEGGKGVRVAESNIDEGRRKPYPQMALKGVSPEETERTVRELAEALSLTPEQEGLLRRAAGTEPGAECWIRFDVTLTREQRARLERLAGEEK